MSIFLTDTPHPAEALQGHTKRVTLSHGGQVLIRKVDIEAITLDSVTHVLHAQQLLKEASEHAGNVSEAAAGMNDIPARSPSFTEADEIQTALEVSKRILRASLVQPRLEQLVEAYGGRKDLSDPDLGLGPDYNLLLGQINDFVTPTETDKEDALRFPGEARDDTGPTGPAVQQVSE